MKLARIILVGFIAGFVVQGLWMNTVGFGAEVFLSGIGILGVGAALSLFPMFRHYGVLFLGLLLGWVGGRIILWLIGMGLGMPLSFV